jgi:hypothetical protein
MQVECVLCRMCSLAEDAFSDPCPGEKDASPGPRSRPLAAPVNFSCSSEVTAPSRPCICACFGSWTRPLAAWASSS